MRLDSKICVVICAVSVSFSFFARAYTADSSRTKPLSKQEFQEIIRMYTAKCDTAEGLHKDNCYLSEKDINISGHADEILIFRGEDRIYRAPETSSYFRWSTSSLGFCEAGCSDQRHSEFFYSAIKDLNDSSSRFFRKEDLSWRDNDGKKNDIGGNSNAMEIVFNDHKAFDHSLYFENSRSIEFDPFVSFSPDPRVAQRFGAGQGNKNGIVWIAKIPRAKLHIVTKSECSNLKLEMNEIYDLLKCVKVANFEFEVDAFMFLPPTYFYGSASGEAIW